MLLPNIFKENFHIFSDNKYNFNNVTVRKALCPDYI